MKTTILWQVLVWGKHMIRTMGWKHRCLLLYDALWLYECLVSFPTQEMGQISVFVKSAAAWLWTEPFVCSGVHSNSKNLWCGQDCRKTVLLPSQRKQLWTKPFVRSNSKTPWCGQDCRKTAFHYFQVKGNSYEQNSCLFPVASNVTPKTRGVGKTAAKRYYFQVKGNSFEQNRFAAFVFQVSSCSKYCQDWPKPVLLPSQSKKSIQ